MIEYKGYKAGQVSNHHIMVTKDGRLVMHAQCNKLKTDDELRKIVDFHIELTEGGQFDEIYNDQEEDAKAKKQTNFDKIKALSMEEMADAMLKLNEIEAAVPFCGNCDSCNEIMDAGELIPEEMCRQCLLNWLQAEVEEGKV